MDVIDLWELLANVDDWSFETFPWDVFSLCHTTVDAPSLSKAPDEDEEESSIPNDEIISYNHVPPPTEKEVPTDHQAVKSTAHSNQSDHREDNDHHAASEGRAEEEEEEERSPGRTLEETVASLRASLEDRSALSAFEKLNKKTEAPMEVAKLPENVPKNRYKDVLPYDESRVVLNGKTGEEEYINASFVHMILPHSVNEYIATQGPLPNTCDDFWEMVWQQNCGIVVMVTTLKERNRVKCHQYWPDLYQATNYGHIQVTCFSETTSPAGVARDFLIINEELNQERHVVQLQYITWPDHGVPQDSTDFLEFVNQLRDLRQHAGGGTVVVHCSAGVGRTGVLILMETALGFIEAGEPLCPMELVKAMRDQRLMMVQTVIQYKFICEAILKAYKDHCAKEN